MGRVGLGVVLLALVLPVGCREACLDGPGISNTLASVDRWIRVISINGDPAGDGTSDVQMEVTSVTPGVEGPPHSETISIHSVFAEGLQDALDEGSDAFVALSRGPNGEIASYVVVRDEDGAHHLPGLSCDQEGFLRDRLGARYDDTLDAIIGVTSAKQIKSALAAEGVG
jgi:hypothetical protein